LHAKYAVAARPRYVAWTVDTGDGTPSLHHYIDVDVDVCISVAVIGHGAGNARRGIRFVSGKHSATKHPGLRSASTWIWSSVVPVSTNC